MCSQGGLSSSTYSCDPAAETEGGGEVKQNGSAKKRWKPDTNGHCVRDKDRAALQVKVIRSNIMYATGLVRDLFNVVIIPFLFSARTFRAVCREEKPE